MQAAVIARLITSTVRRASVASSLSGRPLSVVSVIGFRVSGHDEHIPPESTAPSPRRQPVLTTMYSMSVSLDGFMAGPGDDISWTAPEPEIFRFHIEQTRHLAGIVCGRKLYEAMLVWETAEETMTDEAELEFARLWRPIPKVVFSTTLDSVQGNARLATDDLATEIARLRDQPGDGVVEISGATLAAAAIAEDLIDEYRQFVYPVILGAGTPFFPPRAEPLELELVESRPLSPRVVYLRHRRKR
jgi:dihydrofolate reductase